MAEDNSHANTGTMSSAGVLSWHALQVQNWCTAENAPLYMDVLMSLEPLPYQLRVRTNITRTHGWHLLPPHTEAPRRQPPATPQTPAPPPPVAKNA